LIPPSRTGEPTILGFYGKGLTCVPILEGYTTKIFKRKFIPHADANIGIRREYALNGFLRLLSSFKIVILNLYVVATRTSASMTNDGSPVAFSDSNIKTTTSTRFTLFIELNYVMHFYLLSLVKINPPK